MPRAKGTNSISNNRKAFHDYFILETYEAGLELLGAEIKSIRQKECTIDAAYVKIENNQAYVINMQINPYAFNTHTDLDATRTRRLLLNAKEIKKLTDAKDIKGQTIIPLEVYIKNGWAKLKIGLAKGKKLYDKRETLKKKDMSRDIDRSLKGKLKL